MQHNERAIVRNFRSIEFCELNPGNLTALIGVNGSGKSNLLRALNVFFNGTIEASVPLDFARDFHKPWRSTKNRFTEVEVHFQLPSEFSIRSEIGESLRPLGVVPQARFAIRKHWERDPASDGALETSWLQTARRDWANLSADESRSFARFLRLIRFRYVPNHIHPSEMLAAESGPLQEALMRAVRRELKKAGQQMDLDALLTVVSEAAQELVAPVTSLLQDAPGQVSRLEVTTPGDWAEVAWSLALKLQSSGPRAMDVGLHGSGNQTFLMYALLHFLDTRFSQEFGWHQATIWALEEPESFLHSDLESRLADFLVSSSGSARFQTLLTTHRLLFAAAADQRYEVTAVDGATTATARPVLELAERSLSTGVSPFVHPLNLTPPKPTLLVDGPYDVYYLTEAYRRSGRPNPWDIRALQDIDPAQGSGKETTRKYLQQNQGPLKSRPRTSPVIVLLDWEDSDSDLETTQKHLSGHPTSKAIRWPLTDANPELGDSFHGIEHHLATELVSAVATNAALGIVRGAGGQGPYELMPQTKSHAKQALAAATRARNQLSDLQPLVDSLPWLDGHIPAPEMAQAADPNAPLQLEILS
jgi:hypothetical protein